MKIGIIKDPHSSIGFKNSIRKNHNSQYSKKIAFLKKYCQENDIHHLIITGDIFDNSYMNKWSFAQYISNSAIWEELSESIKLLTIDGNHDQFNGSYDLTWVSSDGTIKKTVYASCVERNIFQHLPSDPFFFKNYGIFGISYRHTKQEVIEEIKRIENFETERKIVVLHQNVTPNHVKNITDFTYEELSKYNIDCFILGHYHVGYESTFVNDVLFINPWNFYRVARDYDVKLDRHKPELVVMSLEDSIKFEHIEIPHLPFKEAFVDDFIQSLQVFQKEREFLFNSIDLSSLKNHQLSDIEIIEIVGKNHEFDERIISEVKSKYLEGTSNE